MDSTAGKVIIAVFMVLGLFFMGVGIATLNNNKALEKRCTYKTEATVVRNVENVRKRNGRRIVSYAPVYAYSYGGRDYEQESSYTFTPKQFEEGERVELYLDPDDPGSCYVPEERGPDFFGTIMLIGGSAMFIVSLLLILVGRSERRQAEALDPYSDESEE